MMETRPIPAQRRTHPRDGDLANPKQHLNWAIQRREAVSPWTVALTPLGATLAHEGPWCPCLSEKQAACAAGRR